MLAHCHFFHWPTASSMTFCDMLAHVSMRRCFKSLTMAGVADRWLYNVHTFLHQSTNSVVNQTVWRTQIWTDKVRCSLLKELDCFTSIEWRQNKSFSSKTPSGIPGNWGSLSSRSGIPGNFKRFWFVKNFRPKFWQNTAKFALFASVIWQSVNVNVNLCPI